MITHKCVRKLMAENACCRKDRLLQIPDGITLPRSGVRSCVETLDTLCVHEDMLETAVFDHRLTLAERVDWSLVTVAY